MSARNRRRGGCGPLAFLLVGALLAALLFGADRAADAYAEKEVAARLRTQLAMASDPKVAIEGFPFLTQVAANRFGEVNVAGDGVVLADGGQSLALRRVRLRLTDVVTAQQFQKVTATGLDGTVQLAWDETARLVKLPIRHGGGDRVLLDASQRVYGQTIRITVSGVPSIDPARQTFTFAQPRAELAGQKVPDSIVRLVMNDVVRPTPLNLPLGLRATGATASADGLDLQLTGKDVKLVG
ncbi:LmeA family phospholipid-binding protein [Mariniluteicoccus flavus]